jgi:MFS family permease
MHPLRYALSLFIYGIGVGGEYPMTSTTALESGPNGPAGTRDDRLHRGRNVVLAFLMQGWGQVFNQVVLLILLLIFNSGKSEPPYAVYVGQGTYRVSFAIIAILHIWLVYYRVFKVKCQSTS